MANDNSGPLSRVILDEIALEGLEGVTIPSLWVYLGNALHIPLPLGDGLQSQVWSFIRSVKEDLYFYELPEERAVVQLYNRFSNLDPVLGVPINPEKCPFARYKYVPIQDNEILGSCEFYKERKEIKREQIFSLTVEEVLARWGNKFVIVGSQDLRYNVLTPPNVPIPKELTPVQYCIWEAIGRGRYNGETTAGAWSLLQFCKDSTIVFYMKNKLIRLGIVAHQPYTEKRSDRLYATTLLTLPRFYSIHKSLFSTIIEKLVHALKETPKHRMTFNDARTFFPTIDKQKAFKKILMTHFFRRLFNVVNIPISEAKDLVEVTDKIKKDRTILVIELKTPDIAIEELFSENNNDPKEESVDFLNEKHSFVDMPIMDELYRCVVKHGDRGCSQTEIGSYMCMNHLTVRQIVRKALEDGLLTSYCTDVGRQRTNMYVAVQHSEAVKKNQDASIAFLKNMQCAEDPNIPPEMDFIHQDIPTISSRIKVYEYEDYNNNRETTLRQVERKALVIKTIDAKCIVQISELRHIIQRTEKENGYKDEVCQKSVRRLLEYLTKRNVVRVYEIMLQCEEHIRIYRYVVHPKIGIDHKVIRNEIFKLKNNFCLSLEERRIRERVNMQNKLKAGKISSTLMGKEGKDLLPLAAYKSPKFLISRYLHEFLYYIMYELNDHHKPIPITEDLIQQWKLVEPNITIRDYLETLNQESVCIIAYSDQISWRTFISPLPKYEEKPTGWILLADAVDRMPLSIFNKIFRLEKCVDPRVSEYLAHPIRQHYLIKQLPSDMQCKISRVRLQNIYMNIIKLLNNMGLVQMGVRTHKDPLQLWVYLNRNAQILDTTTSEASYSNINPDRDYPVLNYEFNSFDDVCHYWTALHRICVHTKLGFRKGRVLRTPGRNHEVNFLNPVQFHEAPQNDVGTVPGDRLGAGGLATHLFSHTFRNWSWVVHTDNKPLMGRTGRISQNSRSKLTKILAKNRKTVVKASGRLSVVPLKRLQVKGVTKRNSSESKKTYIRDAIDRDALKNMRTLRVSWRKEEDDIIKMARAVYLYMSAPVIIFNLVVVGKICRDIIRHHLGSYNKTSQACLRRGQFIVKMNRHLPEVPSWLHMLQTNDYMQTHYGDNFIEKLKTVYPNRAELLNALTIHFVLILNFLYKLINNKNTAQRPNFLIPDSVPEFMQKFRECVPLLDEPTIQYSNPQTEFDLQVAIVINVLHSSLCCTRDKTLYNLQAFEIYKHFGEDVLHAAFKKARTDGLVVAVKRKNMHVVPSQQAGPAYIFSQKYRFRLSFLKIPYGVYDAFYEFFTNALKIMFGPTTSNSPNHSVELKSPNAGQLFLISEGLCRNYWKLNLKLPVNILTVDVEKRSKVSSMERILDPYQCIFENAPETEYIKQLETDIGEKQIRIKFHPANLSYKVHYSPYDIIAKLPIRSLHFFCALDHLEQEADINFNKLQHKEHDMLVVECPFSCIMKHSNYINAIERIVQERKLVLRELQEMPPQKLLNLATSAFTVTVQPNNLLTLVRMLESFWREKELKLEQKDLGKISTTLKQSKSVDWHQLCLDILEYNCNEEESEQHDEQEPTINKEERIARAQDVFVVNLPTLQISASDQLQESTEKYEVEGLEVSKCLYKTAIQRDSVLEKISNESHWKYTDNTFETLKPILVERNLSHMEQQHIEEIHNYIQKHKLGVSVSDLMNEFRDEKFLLRALHILSEHYLIKRVGISSFMYVHKLHIRQWVVHTFHIKRLERESLGSSAITLIGGDDETDLFESSTELEDEGPTSSKKAKLLLETNELQSNVINKRTPKPTKRYNEITDINIVKNDVNKDIIVMKPQPWMRLNGSINRRVLDKWLGSILTECISRSGCLMNEIFIRFPHMMPVDIMFLLEILADLCCIRMRQIQSFEVNLFSEYEDIKESEVTELYKPEDTYLIAEPDALTKLAIFIGKKKYNSEFI